MNVSRADPKAREEANWLAVKTFHQPERKRVLYRHVGVASIVAVLVGCLCGGVSVLPRQREYAAIPQYATCESYTADDAQKAFIIDLPVSDGLSYSAARALDIVWDLIVAQGGRILHAWILCRYVVPAVLTRLLERTALPYPALLGLSFSATSLRTLGSIIKPMFRRPWQLHVLLWLFLVIGYCLLFPTIWSATAGYYQPSSRMFEMPDKSFVNETSGLLRQCWVVDDARLQGLGRQVYLGNTYSSINNSRYSSLRVPIDPAVASLDADVSSLYDSNYLDIAAYVETQALLQVALESWCSSADSGNTSSADLSPFFQLNTTISAYVARYMYGQAVVPSDCSLPAGIRFPQICGPSQPDCTAPFRPSTPKNYSEALDFPLFPPMAFNGTINTTSIHNNTFAVGPRTSLPFNSTLWLNGARYDLSAPTLDPTSGCKSYNGLTCSCYNGEPIAYDYEDPDHTACISSKYYAWGFSCTVLIVVISMESVWIMGCYALWLHAEIKSVLLRHEWNAAGELKSALSIVARVEADLGPEAFAYSQKELEKALQGCDDVGHDLRKGDGKLDAGVMTARRRRRANGDKPGTEKAPKPALASKESLLSSITSWSAYSSSRKGE